MLKFDFYVYSTLLTIICISILLIHRLKTDLTSMSGMIVSMFLGMNVGLTAGILLGTIYQGDLFFSTMLAMLIGAFSGSVTGIAYNPASSIEGFMSGIMGGMMGAMLGEMLPPEKSLVLINIFLTISTSTFFLFKILLQKQSYAKSLKDFVKPVLAFILLSAYLWTGSHLGNVWLHDFIHNMNHNEHHKHP